MENIKEELFAIKDLSYRDFNKKLCPDTKRNMIGIRIPILRNFAKEKLRQEDFRELLEKIDDEYFEEILLQGFLIGYAKCSFEEKTKYIKNFVPKIDSWQISDTFVPTLKIKEKELDEAFKFIKPYFKSKKEFEVRFAVIMLLDYYIREEYIDEIIKILDEINYDGYYVKMAVAWCLAEIGVKYNKKAMEYLKGENKLDNFTFNKTLQKMIESYRIDETQKKMLKNMKKK